MNSQIITKFELAVEQSTYPEEAAIYTIGLMLCSHSDIWKKEENCSTLIIDALSRLTFAGLLECHTLLKETITNLPSPSFIEYDFEWCGCGPITGYELKKTADSVSDYLKKHYKNALVGMPKFFNDRSSCEYRLSPLGKSFKASLLRLIKYGESEKIWKMLSSLYNDFDKFRDVEEKLKVLGYRLVVGGKTEIGLGTLEHAIASESVQTVIKPKKSKQSRGVNAKLAVVETADEPLHVVSVSIEPSTDAKYIVEGLGKHIANLPGYNKPAETTRERDERWIDKRKKGMMASNIVDDERMTGDRDSNIARVQQVLTRHFKDHPDEKPVPKQRVK